MENLAQALALSFHVTSNIPVTVVAVVVGWSELHFSRKRKTVTADEESWGKSCWLWLRDESLDENQHIRLYWREERSVEAIRSGDIVLCRGITRTSKFSHGASQRQSHTVAGKGDKSVSGKDGMCVWDFQLDSTVPHASCQRLIRMNRIKLSQYALHERTLQSQISWDSLSSTEKSFVSKRIKSLLIWYHQKWDTQSPSLTTELSSALCHVRTLRELTHSCGLTSHAIVKVLQFQQQKYLPKTSHRRPQQQPIQLHRLLCRALVTDGTAILPFEDIVSPSVFPTALPRPHHAASVYDTSMDTTPPVSTIDKIESQHYLRLLAQAFHNKQPLKLCSIKAQRHVQRNQDLVIVTTASTRAHWLEERTWHDHVLQNANSLSSESSRSEAMSVVSEHNSKASIPIQVIAPIGDILIQCSVTNQPMSFLTMLPALTNDPSIRTNTSAKWFEALRSSRSGQRLICFDTHSPMPERMILDDETLETLCGDIRLSDPCWSPELLEALIVERIPLRWKIDCNQSRIQKVSLVMLLP